MILLQSETPLLTALRKYILQNKENFHVPAHRQGAALPVEMCDLKDKFFQYDLTELPGLDDLHNPQGAIKKAQLLAAQLYGSQKCYFLVNGTSAGLVALILACCRPGDTIILPRNVHLSVLTGVILSGARPVYLYPPMLDRFGITGLMTVEQLADCLQQYPQAKAVVTIHPTYYGVAGNLKKIAALTHQLNIPLLVDEAHGGHFPFHQLLPPDALSCGADAVVQSTHKVAGSLTQASMLHLNSNLVDQRRVEHTLQMLQTTSPSYLLMASLDAARKQLAVKGRAMLEQTLEVAHQLREKISTLPGVNVLDKQHIEKNEWTLDQTRLVVNLQQAGLSGYQVLKLLSHRYQVQVEMADHSNIVAILGLAANLKSALQLYQGLAGIVREYSSAPKSLQYLNPPVAKVELTPSEAWQSKTKAIPLSQAVGQVSADTVAVYPPGIPVLCPGEVITYHLYQYLLEVRRENLHIQCSGDTSLTNINIIDQ